MSETDKNLPHNPDDKLFKVVFKRPDHVREMLETKAKKKLLAILKLDTLRMTDASFVDEHLSEDLADIVFECETFTKEKVVIPFILEHKSFLPSFPPFQIMHYQDRVWEQQVKEKKPKPTPVLPILFYHGEHKWIEHPWKHYLSGWNKIFKPYTPPGGYMFIDLSKMTDQEIKRFRSGFLKTALLLMKHRLEREYLLENLPEIINFVNADQQIDEDTKIFNLKTSLRYLYGLRSLKWEETMKQLNALPLDDEFLDFYNDLKRDGYLEGKKEGMEVGKREGMEKGMEKATMSVIRSLITHLPEATDDTIANLSSQPITLVSKVRKEMAIEEKKKTNGKATAKKNGKTTKNGAAAKKNNGKK